jgi:hypothetical protein
MERRIRRRGIEKVEAEKVAVDHSIHLQRGRGYGFCFQT